MEVEMTTSKRKSVGNNFQLSSTINPRYAPAFHQKIRNATLCPREKLMKTSEYGYRNLDRPLKVIIKLLHQNPTPSSIPAEESTAALIQRSRVRVPLE